MNLENHKTLIPLLFNETKSNDKEQNVLQQKGRLLLLWVPALGHSIGFSFTRRNSC